ncbi:hypothetical protein TeGR_g1990 [Tetraparma gracilis]|uniref:Uncharacterized protein n=1 Tax=Tetraparma gracilis TaxID=2962635 RepID=A0ABQ6M731_9STRA|nr:hypothetical protein TeGR_g1990 [Tetraparma gracilis]
MTRPYPRIPRVFLLAAILLAGVAQGFFFPAEFGQRLAAMVRSPTQVDSPPSSLKACADEVCLDNSAVPTDSDIEPARNNCPVSGI